MRILRRRFPAVLIAWSTMVSFALAHGGDRHEGPARAAGPRDWHELVRMWGLEPAVVIPLILSAWLYARGVARLWGEAGPGRGVRRREAACFAGGWFTLVVALVSPLHPWGSVLFSAHMTQHELLMLVAAPLLVLGRPLVASLKALPPGWARRAVRLGRVPWWRRTWRGLTNPFVAWAVHAVVLWVWHLPVLFQATLDDEWIHAIQHLSFLASALLFWWAVMEGPQRSSGYGMAVLYMFTTALHSGLLGAIITLASSVWYPAYRSTTHHWGLTPLEDQQLGGLIMWIPACAVYIVAGLAALAAWMRDSERRVQRWEDRSSPVPEPARPRDSAGAAS
jgi:putative membrane protein